MKKYLTKEFLLQTPVIIFLGVMTINLIALVQQLIEQNWSSSIATLALIVMLINWFVMWMMYDRTLKLSEELLEDNWEMAKEAYEYKHMLKNIALHLGVKVKDNTIDLQKVKDRIDYLLQNQK